MRLYYLIAIAAFAVSAASVLGFVGEYRAARLSRVSDAANFRALLEAPPPRPGSLYGDTRIFLACHDALTGTVARVQPAAALKAVASYCRNQATRALESAPRSALAHYTAALAAWKLGDAERANKGLRASQENAAFEGWLAKRRFRLALRLGNALGREGQAALEADIASLLQSPGGRRFLALYYAARPALRERIVSSAERLGQEVQAELLKQITRALKDRAGGA